MESHHEYRPNEYFGIPTSVWVVYLNIILLVAASIAGMPVYVIYFNARGWTSGTEVLFYGIVNFLTPFCTVVLNPLFGFWQGRRPTKELFLFDIVCSAYGYLVMALVDQNRWIWLAGFVLSRMSTSQGSCRTTYIIRTTSEQRRTKALAFQPVAALLGALLGPLLALLCSFAPTIEKSGILFDPNTLTFWLCCFLTLLRLPLLIFGFSEQHFSDIKRSSASFSSSSIKNQNQSDSMIINDDSENDQNSSFPIEYQSISSSSSSSSSSSTFSLSLIHI